MSFDLTSLMSGAILSPFSQLRSLLDGLEPGMSPSIELTIGEPREAMPDFIADAVATTAAEFAKYPPIRGTQALRSAIAAWLGRRYAGLDLVDPDREILPISGSREGLFYICIAAVSRRLGVMSHRAGAASQRPAVLMCNPYYSAYLAGALASGAEPVFLSATAATGHLPDLDVLARDPALLERTALLIIASPANPQGAVASAAYIQKAIDLGRTHDFLVCFDECYSEIYSDEPPIGALQVAARGTERFRNLLVFNSLSKRSNLPGLRAGFCAGDADVLASFGEFRNLCAPTIPLPVQHAAARAWADDAHVEVAREAYAKKFAVADALLNGRLGYERPKGGFCLWLDVSQFGGDRHATVTLWKRAGVKVIPGSFLAQPGDDGTNPGEHHIRLALVQPLAVIKEALERTIAVLR